MNKEVYLDCAASSPVSSLVAQFLAAQFEKKLGNSSSIHHSGVISNIELEKARMVIAKKIGAKPEEIYFTSGATESNNIAIQGIARTFSNSDKKEILISSIEHSSVQSTGDYLAKQGFVVKHIPVNANGEIALNELKKMISDCTLLVSIIHANNEIGVIQDLRKIGEICRLKNIYFHSDGAQAFCKTPTNVNEMNLDLYSLSGHKIHAPKGIGALYVNSNIKMNSLFHGGSQESGLRPGTVPVELASTMAKASELYNEESFSDLISKYEFLRKKLKEKFPNIRIHSENSAKLPNIINFALPGIEGKFLLQQLDKYGIRVSVGSACNSGKKTPSKTLIAIGLTAEEANEAIRVSWGLETEMDHLQMLIDTLCLIEKNR